MPSTARLSCCLLLLALLVVLPREGAARRALNQVGSSGQCEALLRSLSSGGGTARLAAGYCSLNSTPAVVQATSGASFSFTGSGRGQGPNSTLLDLGGVELVFNSAGVKLSLSSLTVVNASLGPGLLELPALLSDNVSQLSLANVDVVANCLDYGRQVAAFAANASGQFQLGPGSTWLFVPGPYTVGKVTATNVNLTCLLPEQRNITLFNSNITGMSFVVTDGRSLFNAVAAVNYLTTNVTQIFVVTDVTINARNWPDPVVLTRLTTIFADPAQRLYMDWTGQQALMVMTDDTTGSVLTVANIDQVNLPPLHGYYAPGCGQATMFTFAYYIVVPQGNVTRFARPVNLINLTMTVPDSEFQYLIALTVVTTTPVGPVAISAQSLRQLFSAVDVQPSSASDLIIMRRFTGVGIDCQNVTMQNGFPQRVKQANVTRYWPDTGTPVFQTNVNNSAFFYTAVNIYSEEDMLMGLQMIQDSEVTEQMVLAVLWANLTLSKVADRWPADGFLIRNGLTFVGLPTGRFPTRWYSTLDLAFIPKIVRMQVVDIAPVNHFFLFWTVVSNMAATPPGSEGIFPLSLPGERPDKTTLNLNWVNCSRYGPPTPGANIILNGTTLVLPYVDYKRLALAAGQAVNGNYLSPTVNMTGLQYSSDNSSWLFQSMTTASGWYAAQSSFTFVAPTPLTALYNNTYDPPPSPPLPPSPGPAESKSISGGEIAGIVVGSVGGASLLIALAAVFVVRKMKKDLISASQHSGGDAAVKTNMSSVDGTGTTPNDHHDAATAARRTQLLAGVTASANASDIKLKEKGSTEDSMTGSKDSPAQVPTSATAAPDELHRMMQSVAQDIDDRHLVILDVLGQGGFGTVYKGMWKGLQVAVKTITFQDKVTGDEKSQQTAILEAAISSSLVHPNVVITYSHDLKPLKLHNMPNNDDGGLKIMNMMPQITEWKLFIIQEYCDAGSLRQAVLKRKFYDDTRKQPRVDLILEAAKQLASGLAHIHSKGIIHGDLNPNNVLLKKEPTTKLGFVCKLCDFGLSLRIPQGQSHISNMRRGTPFYTAPEVMAKGNMTRAADAFSYGVMLWELYASQMCYRTQPNGQFVQRDTFPAFARRCPVDFATLAVACMSPEPSQRPTLAAVVDMLKIMQERLPRGELIAGDGLPVVP